MSAQECHEQAAEHGGARYQTRAAISVAKRCSLAALRLAAPRYGSIFGQISELAVCNALAQAELERATDLWAAVQR